MLFTETVSHAMILQVEPFSECDETKICFVPKLRARFEASSSRIQTMKTVSSSLVTTNGCKVSKYGCGQATPSLPLLQIMEE